MTLRRTLAKEERAVVKAELKDELTKELVTKADLLAVKAELKAEIIKLDGELKLIRFWLKPSTIIYKQTEFFW